MKDNILYTSINEAAKTANTGEATAQLETPAENSSFEFFNKNKEKLVYNGDSFEIDSSVSSPAGDTTPYYVRLQGENGWELGSKMIKLTGELTNGKIDKGDILLNILHPGMPIQMPISESIINDVIGKIENGRAKRGASEGIQWIAEDSGKNVIFYAVDSNSLRSLKNGFMKYKKKHPVKIELANIEKLSKNLQSIQQKINAVCNSTPKMSVEFAHSVSDSLSLCKKCNNFVKGIRSTTTASSEMNQLLLNNKILANMADEKSMKDSFPNMEKRLMIIRKQMLEHFKTDEITEKNQSMYRDILTALVDSSISPDPDLNQAEVEFGNKLASIGVTPEIASNKIYEDLLAKKDKFYKAEFSTEEEAEAAAQAIILDASKKKNQELISETWYKSYVNLLNNILAAKMTVLRKAREFEGAAQTMPGDVETTSPVAANGTSEVPSYSYFFLHDVKFQLKFDIPYAVSLKTDKKVGAWHSILSRLGKAGWECLGYRPQGYINNIINSYATTRDCRVMLPAALLKGSAIALNALGRKAVGHETWFSPDNQKRFQISKWLREEMQTKAGEINPEVKKIESGIVNIPRSIGNGVRQIMGKEKREKPVAHIDTTNFDGSNLAPDRIKYADVNGGKNNGKSGHYKMSENEKEKGKLTRECAEGGAAMSGAVSAGDGFFQMPGSISSEGNPIAPTYTQTPFVKGEKTSVSDSGSGDKFAGDINKKKAKKKDKDEWFNRINSIPDVQKFFDGWGE